ncbi:protein of unknown function [Taphrina deformans PYCC 5710]|uniref:Charged multivesicular body protein 6 n=1 Tax=Taphrina deformans (strain PYCC 5710 / ATCC 11124 / CBS 356.35 / IMI 108563 / JCM 9778 / NBRC 8474) TaxID=1097556 RepID=R4XFQ4_TAPDE|nr:protein of unknown function [Taphrina deformans PYCC 5710]|eukprot:CCG84686.1 protein of unknown function [Taphrina deformans PYCC 5710]
MGAQQSKVSNHDRAILEMKLQRDKLKQYQKRIQLVSDRETEVARQCLARGDKKRALLALRQKKYQEGLLDKTDDQLATLEQLTSNIEFSLVEKDVLYGLAQGNKVLKDIHKELSIDKVERILDEGADAVAYQEEISQLIGQRISNADEDEVLEELARLEDQYAMQFPEAPSNSLQKTVAETVSSDEEAEQEEVAIERPEKRVAQLAS